MYVRISRCRLCRSASLRSLLALGDLSLTGVFPRTASEQIPVGPLEIVKCDECDLVQLAHSYDLSKLYGENYGYRSGLNASMVKHLTSKVQTIVQRIDLADGDLIVDIGSNDCTTLRAYPNRKLDFVGIDPSGLKFRSYYPPEVRLIPDFFSGDVLRGAAPNKHAKVVTSIAMFYDLEDPIAFMTEIGGILHRDGLWVFEQSYLGAMLETNSYDTICHEHLEYYGMKQIDRMARRAGLKIVDVEFNQVNGGSFSITAAPMASRRDENRRLVDSILEQEESRGLFTPEAFEGFKERIEASRSRIREFFECTRAAGELVYGYGASTKGNVLLQYCGIGPAQLPCIAEVNPDKFGCFTPGTHIPIVSEPEARAGSPDYFFVLPWHFHEGIIKREQEFMRSGGRLVFPLPEFRVLG